MKVLMKCGGCGYQLVAKPPDVGMQRICMFCMWNPDRAILLPKEGIQYLRELQTKRIERRHNEASTIST